MPSRRGVAQRVAARLADHEAPIDILYDSDEDPVGASYMNIMSANAAAAAAAGAGTLAASSGVA